MKVLSQLSLLFTTCTLFSAIAFGQVPLPGQGRQGAPRIENRDIVKITTNLVQLDATVVDKNGNIVTGLTADDFEIYENKRKQQITNFSFVELQRDKSSGASSAATITVKSNKTIAIPPMPTSLRRGTPHRRAGRR